MPSILPGFEYDIFISYRHNDNRSGWVTKFVRSLQEELSSTIKDSVSVYFDSNPQDGLLETHNVDKSLEGKLKCLIFIPIISQTYCDPKSFAWQHEFCVFNKMTKEDQFGRDIELSNGNVASRILPVKIHDLDAQDKELLENELGGALRAMDFIYKEPGVNRPLKSSDNKYDNQNKTDYRNQVNKIANAIKEIITSLKNLGAQPIQATQQLQPPSKSVQMPQYRQLAEEKLKPDAPKKKNGSRKKWIAVSTCALLLTIAVFIYNLFTPRTAFTGVEKSIAVLPFINIGNDPNQDYLSDGVTEEIITQLSKIADLKVISRSTAMLYKNSKKPVKQIAEEMRVSSILEGSVQKSGDEIRITAQLIDANTQEHIWAEHYDHRYLNDIFSIQSEVAQQIAHELNARLSKEEKIKLETKLTDNPEAYDLFLKGRYAYNSATLENFHDAENFFQQAIKKDPKFRLAYSYLANVYISLTTWGGDLPPSTGARKAMSVLNNSLHQDTLYIDFTTLAFIELVANKNFARAEYYFKRAISLNPNDELSYIVYAILLTSLGRTEEVFVQLDKAKTISPVYPFEASQRAEAYFASGRYDEAIKTYKEAIHVFPHVISHYDGLGRVYVFKEQYLDAINVLTEFLHRSAVRPPSTIAYMAIAYFKTKNTKRSNEFIQELKQRADKGEQGINIYIAIYYSAINNKEEAFNYLDQALNTNDADLIWLKQEPSFTNLHADPRYNTYLKLVGF